MLLGRQFGRKSCVWVVYIKVITLSTSFWPVSTCSTFHGIVKNWRQVVLFILICGGVTASGTTGDRKTMDDGSGDGSDGNGSRVGFFCGRSCDGSVVAYGLDAS